VRETRRRPTLPGGLPPSTIGAEELDDRVRNGNGYDLFAMATETMLSIVDDPQGLQSEHEHIEGSNQALGRLVPVSYTHYCDYTSGLSTW
jgi:hypothetical protein